MIDVEHLRVIHLPHGCLISINPIDHQECSLDFQDFLLAINCDKCPPFLEEGKKRPDLLVLRKGNSYHEWFVIEIKRQLRTGASEQVQSGLKIIEDNAEQFGEIGSYKPQGLLAYTHIMRTADIEQYRPPHQRDGTDVPLRFHDCGEDRI